METFTAHLVSGLQGRGHQNVVITSHKAGGLPDDSTFEDVPVHRVDYYGPLVRHDLKAILWAKHRVQQIKLEFKPEVVIVHVGGHMAFLQLSTAEAAPAPWVVVAHDLPPTGDSSPTLKQLFEKARHVVAVSRARLEDAQIIAPEAAARMSVIHPCLPWRNLHPDVVPSAAPLVLMAGRLDPSKGFGLAVEAFRRVHAELPEARLVLAGGGPIFFELKDQIRRLGLEGAVRLCGHVPDPDLTRLYQQAWVSLVPSRHSESFGLVALEAMQAACPVVASSTGGLAEVVADGTTGFLFPTDDVASLARCTLKLLKDRSLGIQMGLAGRQRAETHFGWANCLSEYHAILQQAATG